MIPVSLNFRTIPTITEKKLPQESLFKHKLAPLPPAAKKSVSEPAKIKNLIAQGKEELNEILTSSNPEELSRRWNSEPSRVIEEKLISIVWYLMHRASKKGQEFSNGSFLLADPDQKLGKFLSSLQLSYTRISSHLKGQTDQPHRGIDLSASKVHLPYKRGHILFIPVKQEDGSEWLFLKPEKYGTRGAYAFICHSYQYLLSLGRKLFPCLFGSNEGENMRRERVPLKEKKRFSDLIKGMDGAPEALKSASVKGLRVMYECLQKQIQSPQLTETKVASIAQFKEHLEKNYDHIAHRTGNEVILQQQTLYYG